MRNAIPVALALCLLLPACGDGGGANLASTPAPLPTAAASSTTAVPLTKAESPATRPGTYDAIAAVTSPGSPAYRMMTPGEVKITTYQPGPTTNDVSYTIQLTNPVVTGGPTTATATFPGELRDLSLAGLGQVMFKFGDTLTYTNGGITTLSGRTSDGTAAISQPLGSTQRIQNWLNFYDVGLSYVALGEWEFVVADANGPNVVENASVTFVHGDRTSPADLPTSGTAAYHAGTRSGADLALDADFARNIMNVQISRKYLEESDGDRGIQITTGLDLHGSGAIDRSGTFAAPLGGNYTASQGQTIAATGQLNGAFFGPGAVQVGGVYAIDGGLSRAAEVEAFIGIKN